MVTTTSTTSAAPATPAISSSGFDVNSIVAQLMTAEQQPITILATKEASYQAKLSAFGTISGAVSAFQTALNGLSSTSFQANTVSSSDSTTVSASAFSTAVPGTYSLAVTSLAHSQSLVAAGQASITAAIGAGTSTKVTFDFGTIAGNTFDATTGKYGTALSSATTNGSATITVASTANLAVGATISGAGIPPGATVASITDATNFVISAPATATGTGVALQANATFTSNGAATQSITIDSSNNTLQGIRDAINSANMGVSASIINDGSGTPYRLVLASDASGASNSLKITTSAGGDASIAGLLGNDPTATATQNLTESATATNAVLKVNGITITKSSNTVSDAIQGVTLNLNKLTTTPLSLSVARDTTTVSNSIAGFVKAYNDLNSSLTSLSAYNAATQTGAVLQGDATVRTLQFQLRNLLSNAVTGAGTYSTLSSIGVTFQKDGTLALDTTKLGTAISTDFSSIGTLFSSTGGYATTLGNWATNVLSSGGALTSVTNGINSTITDIGKQRTAIQARLVGIEASYRAQYTALDQLLTSMNTTQTFLTQQINALQNVKP